MVKPTGGILTGNSVDISVDMTNFGLVDTPGKPGVAGQGHTHYYLDMLPLPESGNSPVTTPGWFVPRSIPAAYGRMSAPGAHLLGRSGEE